MTVKDRLGAAAVILFIVYAAIVVWLDVAGALAPFG